MRRQIVTDIAPFLHGPLAAVFTPADLNGAWREQERVASSPVACRRPCKKCSNSTTKSLRRPPGPLPEEGFRFYRDDSEEETDFLPEALLGEIGALQDALDPSPGSTGLRRPAADCR